MKHCCDVKNLLGKIKKYIPFFFAMYSFITLNNKCKKKINYKKVDYTIMKRLNTILTFKA